jgi:OPA family glycerol-3-phosphate transporter-like MFS transporter
MKVRKENIIFAVCYIAYAGIYVARLNLSIAAPALKELSVLTTAQLGVLGSVFSLVYATGRLCSGWIADRVKPWIMVSLGLVLCAASNLLCGLLPPFAAFVLLWGCNALAQSMLWGPVLRILSAIYPPKTAQKCASYMGSAVAFGNILGILLTSSVIEHLGLNWAFLVPGLFTLLMSLCALLSTKHIRPPRSTEREAAVDLFRHRGLRNMLFPTVVHGVMKDNISLWMAVYVMDTFALDLEHSAAYILLIPTMGFIGRILAPHLQSLLGDNEYRLSAACFALCVVLTATLMFLPLSAWLAVVCLSLLHMAASIINACMLAFFPLRFAASGQVASVSGVMDFASYLGTGLSAAVYGGLIDSYGYSAMFGSWAVLSLLALLLLRATLLKKPTPQ